MNRLGCRGIWGTLGDTDGNMAVISWQSVPWRRRRPDSVWLKTRHAIPSKVSREITAKTIKTAVARWNDCANSGWKMAQKMIQLTIFSCCSSDAKMMMMSWRQWNQLDKRPPSGHISSTPHPKHQQPYGRQRERERESEKERRERREEGGS